MNEQLTSAFSKTKCARVLKRLRLRYSLPRVLVHRRLFHAMQQPCLTERSVGADYVIKHKKMVLWGDKHNLARKFPYLVAGICIAGIAKSIVILARQMINDAHAAQVPDIASSLPIPGAADRVPEAGGVHPLAPIVRSWQQVF